MLAAIVFAALAAAAPLNPPAPSGGNPQTQQQAAPAQERQDTGANKRGTEFAPLVVQIAQPEGHEAIATKSEGEPQGYANPDWWVAGFTGALFVATAGLWFVTWRLWDSTRKLVGEEQANRKIELRAYISTKVRAIKMEGKILRAYVQIENDGHTPAFNVKIPAMWDVKPPPPFTFPVAEVAEEDVIVSGLAPFTMSKGGSHTLSPKSKIPDIVAFRDKVAAEKLRFYVYGLVTYLDVFGDMQWVEFCSFLDSAEFLVAFDQAMNKPDGIVEAAFRLPPFGNGASFSPDHAEAMEREKRRQASKQRRSRLMLWRKT
jgi:hypothetical protein